MPVSEATYQLVAMEDTDEQWELVCGHLRKKPIMTTEHNRVMRILDRALLPQLNVNDYTISVNTSRLRISTGSYYVPDLCVIPVASELRLLATSRRFEVYEDPMPLVVEVWSPSTGDYDVEQKLQEYQWRGDLEIWRIHPYERTLTIWRRRPDGSYDESLVRGGTLQLVALPGVTIQFERLFV